MPRCTMGFIEVPTVFEVTVDVMRRYSGCPLLAVQDSTSPAESRIQSARDVTVPAASVYPDSDKIAVWTGIRDEDLMVRRSSGVSYYEGEVSSDQ